MRSLKTRILAHNTLVIVLTLLLILITFFFGLRTYYYNGIFDTVKNHAEIANNLYVRQGDTTKDIPSKETLRRQSSSILQFAKFNDTVLDLVTKQGESIASTSGFTNTYIDQEAIAAAAAGNHYNNTGQNPLTGEPIIVVASPLIIEHHVVAILHYKTSLVQINNAIWQILLVSILIGFLIVAIVFLITLPLTNSVTRPIRDFIKASFQMSQGDYNVKLEEHYVAEFGELAKTFNFMAQEIAQSEEMKNEFISSISHELLTPLTSIKGWSETIYTDDTNDVHLKQDGLQIISSETDRLISLVQELLDFSRFQTKKVELSLGEFDLSRLIANVIRQMSMKAQERTIALQFSEQPFMVIADENRLKQVFINLVSNAIKFSPPQTTVQLCYVIDEHFIHIQVRDEGIGIPESEITNVTKTFYQVDAKKEGTGLGLAICKSIVEHHEGYLTIQSEWQKGTTITVSLPLIQADI